MILVFRTHDRIFFHKPRMVKIQVLMLLVFVVHERQKRRKALLLYQDPEIHLPAAWQPRPESRWGRSISSGWSSCV